MAGRPLRRARLAAAEAVDGDFVSVRFLRELRKASPPLQRLVAQEVRSVLLMRAGTRDWVGQYDHVKMFGKERVIEVDLGGGSRLLAHVGPRGQLTLLRLGPHGWFRSYGPSRLEHDLRHRDPLPERFLPGRRTSAFDAAGSDQLVRYANEVRPEWLYFLDDNQTVVTDAVVSAVEDDLLSERRATHLLVGGPGTGKTSVLLQILMQLSDSVVESRETWDVRVDISDRLATFINASTGWDLDAVRRPVSEDEPADVLLIDDPRDVAHVRRAGALLDAGVLGALVVGFDPLQLSDSIDDRAFDALAHELGAQTHVLSTCYRQKAAVGEAALEVARVVAESSPFLVAAKQESYRTGRTRLTKLANTVAFVNPSGRVVVEERADLSCWQQYTRWLRAQELWTHWALLLVVVDDDVKLPGRWVRSLDGVPFDQVRLRDALQIKGLEYQHVALVLSPPRHRALRDGFAGSGRSVYNDFRLARIPFSRAKDSIATFVVDGDSAGAA
jgi:hypothetical protein